MGGGREGQPGARGTSRVGGERQPVAGTHLPVTDEDRGRRCRRRLLLRPLALLLLRAARARERVEGGSALVDSVLLLQDALGRGAVRLVGLDGHADPAAFTSHLCGIRRDRGCQRGWRSVKLLQVLALALRPTRRLMGAKPLLSGCRGAGATVTGSKGRGVAACLALERSGWALSCSFPANQLAAELRRSRLRLPFAPGWRGSVHLSRRRGGWSCQPVPSQQPRRRHPPTTWASSATYRMTSTR